MKSAIAYQEDGRSGFGQNQVGRSLGEDILPSQFAALVQNSENQQEMSVCQLYVQALGSGLTENTVDGRILGASDMRCRRKTCDAS